MREMSVNTTAARLAVALVALLAGGVTDTAAAATAPVKQVVFSRAGWNVNETKVKEGAPQAERNVCEPKKYVCRPAEPEGKAGGLKFSEDVAGGKEATVYAADAGANRVEEFSSTGRFILMFGKEVNRTTKGNLCTEIEVEKGVECQAGVAGSEAGAMSRPGAVAVDSISGEVYVLERAGGGNTRVDKFTSEGKFVWMIGKEVNKTTKGNLCTEAEVEKGAECKAGLSGAGTKVTEHGAFANPLTLAVGPGPILYVGDEQRVQEFDENGNWVGEIRESLEQISAEAGSTVSRLAADPSGNLFLVYETKFEDRNILEFDPTGKEIEEFAGSPNLFIIALAVDPASRLAVVQNEGGELLGLLYQVEGKTLRLITEFEAQGDEGISFDHAANPHLYAAHDNEVIAYEPVPVGELNIELTACRSGAVLETDVTLECELKGTVDPWGVKETEAWFLWGRTAAFDEETPKIPVPSSLTEGEEEPLVGVKATITGMVPHETIYARMDGEDANVKSPELLTSAIDEKALPSVPPRVVGSPTARFVRTSSADLFDEINPENTQTEYWFEYAAQESCGHLEGCATVGRTKALVSGTYGKVGVMLEVSGLQPGTGYIFRLSAVNQNEEEALNEKGEPELPEGRFTTAPATSPSAVTGAAEGIGKTTATITGAVDPDGREASYSFELGIYSGSNTQYATVASGSAGAGSGLIEKIVDLVGLQPATVYAYRIDVHSGYIDNETHTVQGVTRTFTTEAQSPLVQVPPVPQLLATPPTPLPPPPPPIKCKKGHKLSQNKCARVTHKAKAKHKTKRRTKKKP